MILLTENLTFDQAKMNVELITEGDGDKAKKDMYMTGIFIQANTKNLNQRIYPTNEIQRAVKELNSIIDNGESVLGECDHPEELTIGLADVSHIITKMWMEGNNGMGRLKLLDTPKGLIVKTILSSGGKLGVSSRGSGNVNDKGIVEDFSIVTIDIVARPSCAQAIPKVVYESFGKRTTVITDLSQAAMYDPKAQKFLKEEILKWINNLKY